MDNRFAVRRVRLRDLGRILEIEAASFGADAYDRNLFAEYTRKCGGLFLVAEWGNKVCAYSITVLSPGGAGKRAELVSVAVDPAFRGKGAAHARQLEKNEIAERCLRVVRDADGDAAIGFAPHPFVARGVAQVLRKIHAFSLFVFA